jgi:5-methylcytosine-specific restriction endonuclease McrBC GTP-binding regulatory subunit McrB
MTEPETEFFYPLNTILYGPPGTGKTHNVVNYVLEIIDGVPVPEEQTAEDYAAAKARFDELKAQGRVAFATFHQSYGYEDFIEGIRPALDGESGGVAYELHDGVFKAFCKRAQQAPDTEPSRAAKAGKEEDLLEALRRANDVVWKVSLGGSLREGRPDLEYNKRIHDDCFEDGNIRIGWDQYGPLPNESTDYFMGGQSVLDSFIHKAAVGDIVVSLRTSSEIDGIGVIVGDYEWTGQSAEREEARYDYYNRIRPVRWIVRHARLFIRDINDRKELSQVTFYRTGISKASILALAEKALAGRFAKVQRAEAETGPEEGDRPYVFIIDEINRGNISKIFGELITLVEAGKRLGAEEETMAVLPYSGEEFGVPPNVYILGTMNTADRSIALLDTALRRRFDFVEMMPRPELLGGLKVVDGKGKDTGIDLEKMLAAMNGRIEFLLDREHTIGHAYFLGGFVEGKTIAVETVADIFQFKIVPLLQEYFFEDYAKIRLVLGDASFKRKVPGFQFVTEEKGLARELFPGVPEDFSGPVNGDRALYRINGEAFDRVEAYLGIYQPVAGGGGGTVAGPEEGE